MKTMKRLRGIPNTEEYFLVKWIGHVEPTTLK